RTFTGTVTFDGVVGVVRGVKIAAVRSVMSYWSGFPDTAVGPDTTVRPKLLGLGSVGGAASAGAPGAATSVVAATSRPSTVASTVGGRCRLMVSPSVVDVAIRRPGRTG